MNQAPYGNNVFQYWLFKKRLQCLSWHQHKRTVQRAPLSKAAHKPTALYRVARKDRSMIDIRKFGTLGHANHGWLDAHHHFSFADYYDDDRVHWGALRVWNDDRIAAQNGFQPHPHRDMEIITYVRSGAITNRASMGHMVRKA